MDTIAKQIEEGEGVFHVLGNRTDPAGLEHRGLAHVALRSRHRAY